MNRLKNSKVLLGYICLFFKLRNWRDLILYRSIPSNWNTFSPSRGNSYSYKRSFKFCIWSSKIIYQQRLFWRNNRKLSTQRLLWVMMPLPMCQVKSVNKPCQQWNSAQGTEDMRQQSWQIAGNLHMSEASGRNSKGWVDSECYVNYRLFISLKKCKHSSILVENNSFQLFVRITIFPPDVAFVESESRVDFPSKSKVPCQHYF